MRIQPVYNKVLVEVESEWISEHKTKSGVVGITFENDIDRSVGAQRKGKILAIPRAVSKNHFFLKLVQDTVAVNDIAYFHFNAIVADSKIELKIEDKPCYLVDMDQIFCLVREGCIIMYGGRVLAEPIYDEDVVLVNNMLVRKTRSGIISEINVKHNLKKARLKHIGNPLKNQTKPDVVPGDTIYYEEDADFENIIEGENLFCMIQDDIQLKEIE